MRTPDQSQEELLYAVSIETLIPADHPLRAIRKRCDQALDRMQPLFATMYSHTGRPAIAPERLLRALLLQVLYGYRSERRLMQEMQYNFALRWFVGLALSEQPWDVTVFTKNRERLLKHDLAQQWLAAVVEQARQENLLDEEHFSVDGTLLQAWASEKSYQPKDDPPAPGQGSGRNGRLQRRDLYESKTDADARLYRKSRREPYRLSYLGHLVTENAHGLIVASAATHASATGERDAAKTMLEKVTQWWHPSGPRKRVTVGADKAYHQQDFVESLQQLRMEPHIGAYATRTDLIGAALRRTRRYRTSMRRRKWIERCFAWIKGPAGLRQTRFRGLARVGWNFTFAAAAYNLLRITRLLKQPA
jgi:transposase